MLISHAAFWNNKCAVITQREQFLRPALLLVRRQQRPGDGLWLSRPTTEGVRDVARGGVHLSPQPLLCCCLQAVHSFSTPLCLSCLPPPLWRCLPSTQHSAQQRLLHRMESASRIAQRDVERRFKFSCPDVQWNGVMRKCVSTADF